MLDLASIEAGNETRKGPQCKSFGIRCFISPLPAPSPLGDIASGRTLGQVPPLSLLYDNGFP
ncbi:MAG: hypothetical protein JWL62_1224 [Hyphomicrobiales bacterium]|nr:hypothetical protein [Hyphomicrobiales bacterium]